MIERSGHHEEKITPNSKETRRPFDTWKKGKTPTLTDYSAKSSNNVLSVNDKTRMTSENKNEADDDYVPVKVSEIRKKFENKS